MLGAYIQVILLITAPIQVVVLLIIGEDGMRPRDLDVHRFVEESVEEIGEEVRVLIVGMILLFSTIGFGVFSRVARFLSIGLVLFSAIGFGVFTLEVLCDRLNTIRVVLLITIRGLLLFQSFVPAG